ncbi:unnamed protein product [marine sediment metagenome]|uniref:Uncharacterized protein n=1 Tax=marine sediment metagenome TaxID=412755 RepID=X1HE20_9ZZZZ
MLQDGIEITLDIAINVAVYGIDPQAGMKWEQMSLNPTEMDWLNLDKVTLRKICTVFNIAPELMGGHGAEEIQQLPGSQESSLHGSNTSSHGLL